MKTWTVKGGCGRSDYLIRGETLKDAVEDQFENIAKGAGVGNAAGWKLAEVTLSYNPAILGGTGGAELCITAWGADLAHRKADAATTTTCVWIYATPADVPELINLPF